MAESILKLDIYTKYRIKFEFRGRVFGGYPKATELIAPWIKSRTGFDDDLTKQQVTEAEQAMESQALEESSWTGFPSDPGVGLYLDTRAVKSGMRECFSVARIFVDKPGTKQIFQHALVVDGLLHQDRLYFTRGDKFLAEPDGYIERPIHPETAQGKRSALKRADYVENAQIEFLLRVLTTHPQEKRHIGRGELELALTLFQEDGLGADRSQCFGRFNVIEIEELGGPEPKAKKSSKVEAKK